jgi:hypothetical protein
MARTPVEPCERLAAPAHACCRVMARHVGGAARLTPDPRCVIKHQPRPDLRTPGVAAGASDEYSPLAVAMPPAILPPQTVSPRYVEQPERGPPPRRVLIDPRRAPRAPPAAAVRA